MAIRGKQFTPTDLAYMAGFIDGEGTVSIYRKHYGKIHQEHWSPYYTERILIVQVNTEPLLFIRSFFPGGSLTSKKRYNVNHQPCYVLSYTGKYASEIIRHLLPYLKVKRAAAEIMLQYRDGFVKRDMTQKGFGFQNKTVPLEERARREGLYLRIREITGVNGQPQRLSEMASQADDAIV